MESLISSNKNKNIKLAKSLLRKKYRDLTNQYLVEGIKIVKEALAYNERIKMVFVSSDHKDSHEIKEILNSCRIHNIPIYYLEKSIYKEISETDSTQGIIAMVEKKEHKLELVLDKDFLKIIILEEIQDPGNLGTILRTADACNYDFVILSKGCVDLYNDKSIRATMGSLFHLPIACMDIIDAIELLKSKKVVILGSDPHEGVLCYNLSFEKKLAIIIGNESAGISEEVLKLVDERIRIPMPGKSESLNASVAASILMYESIRQRE